MRIHPVNLSDTNLTFYPRSLVSHDDVEYGLTTTNNGLKLIILAPSQKSILNIFEGECSELDGKTLLVGSVSPRNAVALRSRLDWLQPRLLGRQTSAGMGDRIGLATPGHVRAAQAVGGIAPIFAQQSIREMARTGRTPQQVMDDATWGIFQEGWREGVGADADHLKTPADIDLCLAAGYTFYTIDPGAQVDLRAETASLSELRELIESLPVEIHPNSCGLSGKDFDVEGLKIHYDELTLAKAVVKYGKAIAHVAMMYRHLADTAGRRPFELEVSVDETEQPTSHAEHFYIASELMRMGVHWVSLAPRYVGRFEKGVDYIGDINDFERDFSGHAAIARHFGGYKLSLHSGSDKFSIYPIAARLSHGSVHLKTAGTSYLEALRTIATEDVDFFREIYLFSRERYETDKASYHVSAEVAKAGAGLAIGEDGLPDEAHLPLLLADFHAREILHVTFGSVLTEKTTDGQLRFYDRLIAILRAKPDTYAENLKNHFIRHLSLFVV
jgi:tagaturonate epimerase